jgi:ribosome maturation factor RimP
MPPATAGRSPARTREHLLDVLGPVVAAAGCDLEEVAVTAAGRRSLVRVTVDADGGVDLDAVAAVSRAIAEALDAEGGGAFAGPYVLEVSSPGVDRALTEPRHWRRAEGRRVKVTVGDETISGRVLGTSGEGVRLDVDGAQRDVAWGSLGAGKVQVEFSRTAADDADGAAVDGAPDADAADGAPDGAAADDAAAGGADDAEED